MTTIEFSFQNIQNKTFENPTIPRYSLKFWPEELGFSDLFRVSNDIKLLLFYISCSLMGIAWKLMSLDLSLYDWGILTLSISPDFLGHIYSNFSHESTMCCHKAGPAVTYLTIDHRKWRFDISARMPYLTYMRYPIHVCYVKFITKYKTWWCLQKMVFYHSYAKFFFFLR